MFFCTETKSIRQALHFLHPSSSFAPVILCIGSDRVTGDCFGPLVGEYLTKTLNVSAYVYGTLSSPVTALNLTETVQFIHSRHPLHSILAIDSALGCSTELGVFRIFPGSLAPGAASGKQLPKVGEVSLTVTVAGKKTSELLNVRLGFVDKLAKVAGDAINSFLESYGQNNLVASG